MEPLVGEDDAVGIHVDVLLLTLVGDAGAKAEGAVHQVPGVERGLDGGIGGVGDFAVFEVEDAGHFLMRRLR